jgi:hypothetical protein
LGVREKPDSPKGTHTLGELQTAIEGAHRVAREILKQAQQRMKSDYDVKVRVRVKTRGFGVSVGHCHH